jgi:hypothetical protein
MKQASYDLKIIENPLFVYEQQKEKAIIKRKRNEAKNLVHSIFGQPDPKDKRLAAKI